MATPDDRLPVPADVPAPEQVALLKNVKATVPVGVPAPVPDTVAWSVTVEPSGTEVTVAPPICTAVVVELVSSWTSVDDPALAVWVPTGQFDEPVPVHTSVKLTVTLSERMWLARPKSAAWTV